MTEFQRLHAALFDELERQGAMNVDVDRLARAVLEAQPIVDQVVPGGYRRRCANGACDD